jgi:hypothetical protein
MAILIATVIHQRATPKYLDPLQDNLTAIPRAREFGRRDRHFFVPASRYARMIPLCIDL